MPGFSTALANALSLTTTKAAYTNTIATMMGNTLRLSVFHDAQANAPDPAATGTECLNMAVTGPMKFVAGNIVDFGKTGAITVRAAGDMGVGTNILRLSGNGHSITFTLGLPGSGKEFEISANPSASPNVGYAFRPRTGLKAPMSFASGTGPVAPLPDADAPYSVTLEDWTSGAAVPVKTILFDTRRANWIFDDMEVSENMGDIRVDTCSQTITFGQHEFGAVRFVMTHQMNSQDTKPVYQVLVNCKPLESNWPGYPAYSGYNKLTTDTFPGAYKVVIKNQAGGILKTHEMRDGLPINSPQLTMYDPMNKPMRPNTHCAQVLPWQSARPKKNTYVNKWFPGVPSYSFRATSCRGHYATNQVMPHIGWYDNINGAGSWYFMPKWPFPADPAKQTPDTVNDPLVTTSMQFNQTPWGGLAGSRNACMMTGWGYEPGAFGPMDQLYGPGGSRANRMVIGTPYAIYLSNPDYVRPRNNDVIAEMIDHQNLHFFNMGMYWFQDVKNFATIPIKEVFAGVWGGGMTYYGHNDSYVEGGNAKTIPFFAMNKDYGITSGAPNLGAPSDKNGRAPWNGFSFDWEHNYDSPAMVAAFFGSPMHALAAKHRFIASQMAQVSWTLPGKGADMFMQRDHAWRWLHIVHGWKIGSDHEFGMTRQDLEDYLEADLNAIYDKWYKPAFVDNRGSTQDILLKNMGIAAGYSGDYGWGHTAHGITFYIGGVMGLMKQYGLYRTMANKSDKCKKALELIIHCLDRMTIEFILKFGGRNPNYNVFTSNNMSYDSPVFVKTWAELAARDPRNGQEDWTTDAAGNWLTERADTEHMRFQWVSIRKNVFPELPYTETANGVELAYQAYKAHYDKATAGLTATPARNDFKWHWAGFGEWLPPTVVEPII